MNSTVTSTLWLPDPPLFINTQGSPAGPEPAAQLCLSTGMMTLFMAALSFLILAASLGVLDAASHGESHQPSYWWPTAWWLGLESCLSFRGHTLLQGDYGAYSRPSSGVWCWGKTGHTWLDSSELTVTMARIICCFLLANLLAGL